MKMDLNAKKHRLRMLGLKIDNEVAAEMLDLQTIIELQKEYNNLSMQIEAEENLLQNKPATLCKKEAISEMRTEPRNY